MAPEVIGRCTEPFFTTKDTGSGLGLAIVAETVSAAGGSIRMESKEGAGSVFMLSLPSRSIQVSICQSAIIQPIFF